MLRLPQNAPAWNKQVCNNKEFAKWEVTVSVIVNFPTSGTEEVEEPRPTYWGEKRTSPITGQQEYYYRPWKRKVKTYGVSYPIVLLCMKVATVIVLLYFRFLDAIETRYANASGIVATVMLLLPSIIYAVVIAVMNNLYLRLATFLTEWGECGNKTCTSNSFPGFFIHSRGRRKVSK